MREDLKTIFDYSHIIAQHIDTKSSAYVSNQRNQQQSTIRTGHHRSCLTMANREPSSPAAPSRKGRIKALKPNDVLMGRGRGPSQYIGNRRFLELVDTRKDEYTSTVSYIVKRMIAQQVYHEIKSRGGRFLNLVSGGKPSKNIIDEGVWCDAGLLAGLERCKQALRAKRRIPEASSRKKSPGEIEKDEWLGHFALDDDKTSLSLSAAALHVPEQQKASIVGTKVISVCGDEDEAEALMARSSSDKASVSLSVAAFQMSDQQEEPMGGNRASSACGNEGVAESLTVRLSCDEASLSLSHVEFNLPEHQGESSGGTRASSACGDEVSTEALMARSSNDENAYLTHPGGNITVTGEGRQMQGTVKGHKELSKNGKGGKRFKRILVEDKEHVSSLSTIACSESPLGSFSRFEGRIPVAASRFQTFGHQLSPTNSITALNILTPVPFERASPPYVDTRLLLFQMLPFAFPRPVTGNVLSSPSPVESATLTQSPRMQCLNRAFKACRNVRSGRLGDVKMTNAMQMQSLSSRECTNSAKSAGVCEDISLPVSVPDDDGDDIAESFLSVFDIDSCQPRITEEQEEMEKATMTDEERVAALSDMFGLFCSVSSHQSKRARKDFDNESIQFLLNQMKIEINRIPVAKKQALLEAWVRCEPFEFSDDRLERFLRCEGMNAEVRAFERIVLYVFEGYECVTLPSLDLLAVFVCSWELSAL